MDYRSSHAWGDRVTVPEPFVFRGFTQEPAEEEEKIEEAQIPSVFNQDREDNLT